MYAKVAPRIMRPARNDDGDIIYDSDGDDRKPLETIDVPVATLAIKLWERKARLYGLDMERSAGMGDALPTAELIAQVFGWDTDGPPIEGTCTELPAQLDSGADPH